MSTNSNEPQGTTGRNAYYDAALICILLICDQCKATLDPDIDVGPNQSFQSDGYFVLLGDEAYRRGWLVEQHHGDFKILCPACAGREMPKT